MSTQTPVEIAGHRLIDYIAELRGGAQLSEDSKLGALTRLADDLEEALVRQEAARIEVPRIAEVTGNVEERELAARLMEEKAKGAKAVGEMRPQLADCYGMVRHTFLAAAADFRAGLHLPHTVIEGKVIPYNQDNDTGIKHADALRTFFSDVHLRNVKAGWWNSLETGEPLKRSVGEMFMLFVTEIAEAYMAWQNDNEADDKLPDYPGLGVELGDLLIRAADFCGALADGRIVSDSGVTNPGDKMFQEVCMIARHYESIRKTPEAVGEPEVGVFLPPMDVAEMIDAKLAYNAHREDHKVENRLKDGGKKT